MLLGNPVSAHFAEKTAQKYVEQNFPELNLTLGSARYDFKFNNYMVKAQSNESEDTHFDIFVRNGRVMYDSYDSVLEKRTTISRLEKEYEAYVKQLLSDKPEFSKADYVVFWAKDIEIPPEIQLDMPFDKTLFSSADLIVYHDLPNPSPQTLAKFLKDLCAVMDENRCKITSYEFFSRSDDVSVMLSGVSAQDVRADDFEAVLGRSLNSDKPGKIYFSIVKEDGE